MSKKKTHLYTTLNVFHRFMLKWGPFLALAKKQSKLEIEWKNNFIKAMNHFKEIVDNLHTGQIKLIQIKLLKEHFPTALSLLELMLSAHTSASFSKDVQLRWSELHEFDLYRHGIGSFCMLCVAHFEQHIDVDTLRSELAAVVDPLAFDALPLNVCCKVVSLDTTDAREIAPIVTFFTGIDAKYFNEIKRINKLDRAKCVLFDEYFNQTLAKQKVCYNLIY